MKVAIIGGGPAGLMAAETARAAGAQVDLYDAMPSVGRKLLLAGKGGLNLTHSEPLERFLSRYGARRASLEPFVASFHPEALRNWAKGLDVKTFVGSSGRIFPLDLKAAPLLRTWLRRLRKSGVRFHMRHRWNGWDLQGALLFATQDDTKSVNADATVLALGGASWPQLGSDAAWVPVLRQRGVAISPLRPANCGFDVKWTEHVKTKFAGQPVKSVAVRSGILGGAMDWRRGEFVITETGVEGGVIYALSALLRDEIESSGMSTLILDLSPDRNQARLARELARPKGKRSIASHLKRYAGISGVKSALLHEILPKEQFADSVRLAEAIKALPIKLVAPRPLGESISTAGGVRFEALDDRLMIRDLPGVFCAGEMLDWEAPTGGYLLTACFATGRAAGAGAVKWLRSKIYA